MANALNHPPPRPFLKWAGGKRQLLPVLLRVVEQMAPSGRYFEPFLGGGALFFALARDGRLPGAARLTDVNDHLITTYIGVRDAVDDVILLLREHARRHDEAYFYAIRAAQPAAIPERAARVIYLNQTCFNGLYRENSKGEFNTPFGRYAKPRILDERNLRSASVALQRVDLRVADFAAATADVGQGDFVYFDPPYIPLSATSYFTAYSAAGFTLAQQARLATLARTLAARGAHVVVSNSASDGVYALYRDRHVYRVQARRNVNSDASRRGEVHEALITSSALDLKVIPEAQPAPRQATRLRAGQWLIVNGYTDVVALIARVERRWKRAGKKTRRNWWQVLAGDAQGQPRTVEGIRFPVLHAARIRMGLPEVATALRHPGEEPPVR
ncbi:MAG: DNA adenine methylase [Gammaproteobacteria bacterium]|nr:DNA adenine methylase [Gammaproteobacteria bacterium]